MSKLTLFLEEVILGIGRLKRRKTKDTMRKMQDNITSTGKIDKEAHNIVKREQRRKGK